MMFTTRIIALVAVAGLSFTGTALAHTKLVSSTPAANATVAASKTIMLAFNEKVMVPFASVDVTMTSMPGMANHKPMKLNGLKSSWSSDGKTMTLTAGRAFPAGSYQVAWRAAGSDTHRIEGKFSFSVK